MVVAGGGVVEVVLEVDVVMVVAGRGRLVVISGVRGGCGDDGGWWRAAGVVEVVWRGVRGGCVDGGYGEE